MFQEYFAFSNDNEVRHWLSDRCRQFSHSTEWFLSFAKNLKVPIATSKDLKEWQLGSETAPLHVLRTRPQEVKNKVASGAGALVYIFTFPQQLKHLSGCCEYHSQHFERPDKSIERASCTVAEEWPQPPEPSSSSTPVPAQAQKKRRVTIGYDMEKVRQYVRDEHAHGLVTREDEDCDMKVIFEVFGRACYKPSDNTATALLSPKSSDYVLDLGGHIGTATRWFLEQGISGADVYEPSGTYDTLQKNLGKDARVTLHQQAVVHETSSSRCGGCKADFAHGDPDSDSVVIRAGGETFY